MNYITDIVLNLHFSVEDCEETSGCIEKLGEFVFGIYLALLASSNTVEED